MAASNRLYPPVLDYAMPAFALENLETTGVRIYFSIPVYNSVGDIGSVHVTVRYLDSNANALAGSYPAKIKICQMNSITLDEDPIRFARNDKYYITLFNSDLAKGFETGTVYKIQLRFSALAYTAGGGSPSASWFNEYYANFSEWSTVSLIRPIQKPEYTVLGLEDAATGSAVSYTSVDSVFTVTYSQKDQSEPLKSWRARLYDENKAHLLADSSWQTYNNYNYLPVNEQGVVAFDAILPYEMSANHMYVLVLDIETRNGYTSTTDFPFACIQATTDFFDGSVSFDINEEEGYATVHVASNFPLSNNVVVRRTSSRSNFTVWEDISVKTVVNNVLNWDFKDFTIESGVWYRYGVQIRDVRGRRGPLSVLTDIKMGEFEHAFLLGEGGVQLKLKYDFNISTANITVSENKTDTIGSKYPFVRRNGNMYYRTFQCSGLITGYMDMEEHLFTTNAEILDQNTAWYKTIRDQVNEVVNQYDYTYEREFRRIVQDFLYDNKVKLFKSLQEGNILVKLLNISLTPKNNLGRLLYSFAAQAIEIGEPTIQNFNDYKLQVVGAYSTSIHFSQNRLGQVSSFNYFDSNDEPVYKVIPARTNLIQEISKNYGWNYNLNGALSSITPSNGLVVKDFQVTHLRIEFESPPYLILRSGDSLTPFDDLNYSSIANSGDMKDLLLGWLLYIDGVTVLVQPPNNIYELKDDALILHSNSVIYPYKDCEMSVYYAAQINQEVDESNIPVSLSLITSIGQLWRIFTPDTTQENIVALLSNQYTYNDRNTRYTFSSLNFADIEADPGTIMYARSTATSEDTKFIMNETGHLLLDPGISDINIASLHFEGKEFDFRYVYTDNNGEFSVDKFTEIHNNGNSKPTHARDFDYYIDSELGLQMFYHRKWRNAIKINDYTYDIQFPVEAIINYQIQQTKGVYST